MLRAVSTLPWSRLPSSHHPSNSYSNPFNNIPNSSSYSSSRFSLQFLITRQQPCITQRRSKLKCPQVSCKMHSDEDEPNQTHDEFLQASILLSETIKHYHLRKQGFNEEDKRLPRPYATASARVKDFRAGINTIGLGILRRFQNPTIFLKISCEGDFLLPIVVGEFAVESLIASSDEDVHEDDSNYFQFVSDIVLDLGYEVDMVKITKRVVNTFFARIYFSKAGERASFSVDARPSDAINVAKRCKVPIYVNKQIVLTDAIRVSYGTGRIRDTKPIYDVLLDSPMEGPDLLGEELRIMQKMELAATEERYEDAAMWRDKLVKLQNSGV